jgi:hypothetical protein
VKAWFSGFYPASYGLKIDFDNQSESKNPFSLASLKVLNLKQPIILLEFLDWS